MNSEALDFKSISIRILCITAVTIVAAFLLLALSGCGPSKEERIEQAVSQPLEAIKAKDEATFALRRCQATDLRHRHRPCVVYVSLP
mgnify:CR=1 FL=1